MANTSNETAVGASDARRLFVYNGGFLTQGRIKRILELSGYQISLGVPKDGDMVGVWGNSPTSHRGEAIAEHRNAPILRVEDTWLRSLYPGRDHEPPLGLCLDQKGVHYDASAPSDLETLLATHPLDDTALMDRARGAIDRMIEAHLTKYSAVDPEIVPPAPGYVLVVDQTEGDAAVKACGADRNRFLEMLFVAQEEHPGAKIIIKTHPETSKGHRPGYFTKEDTTDNICFYEDPISPWVLLEGAIAVYTVSSTFGFEAIFAGHKPRVFGTPFYAGWGLTQDEFPVQRRQRTLTRAQLFAAAVLLYPKWYDRFNDCLCNFEVAMEHLAAEARSWREDRHGWVASSMRLWKRDALQKVFGSTAPMIFEDEPARARATHRPWMVWASKATVGQSDALRVEDGFLRSRGLGAELVPPLSLVVDDKGIYYDASKPSRLEYLIAARANLRSDQRRRADHLIRRINDLGLTKYNTGGARPDLPDGHRILVVGQVEDDASLVLGGGDVRTNQALLYAARAANPDAVLIYKPHPDVEAGLRDSATVSPNAADFMANAADTDYLLSQVQEVWTMTSLLGFEALLRGVRVTTLGMPFYAGWGLTTDLFDIPPRRRATPDLAGMVHACLIDYPRYFHPQQNAPCPVETIVDLLAASNDTPPRAWHNRILAKLQGVFTSKKHLWR
ncbi:MAG: capsular polysaccharide biosynthesis protein [Roseobacter sp.]